MSEQTKIKVAILGASGYTGAELLRLLAWHPHVEIVALTAETQAGQKMADVFPHLSHRALPDLVTIEQVAFANIDLVFCCLPHGTTQAALAKLPRSVRMIDLSADFRLCTPELYAEWYGHPHQALALQSEAVYGLTEHNREAVKDARLVANPGCYPTCTLLPLLPLFKAGILASSPLIVDAKSGVSGAGRAVKRQLLYNELDEGMSAYGVGEHRHMPEIEQELSAAAGTEVQINFSAHLIPMRRGMIATIYAKLSGKAKLADIQQTWQSAYNSEPFVQVLAAAPSTHAVRGTNLCQIAAFAGRRADEVILVSAIDNLCKGASGQAVQNMNVMYGWPETLALPQIAVFP